VAVFFTHFSAEYFKPNRTKLLTVWFWKFVFQILLLVRVERVMLAYCFCIRNVISNIKWLFLLIGCYFQLT